VTAETSQAVKTPMGNEERPIGKALWWGIALAPYVFAWFTLQRGFSSRARRWSFTWLTVFLVGTLAQELQGKGPISTMQRNISREEQRSNPPTLHQASPSRLAARVVVPPAPQPAAPAMTLTELQTRLARLRKASKDDLHDLELKPLREQIDRLPESERASLEAPYRDVLRKASSVKAKYAFVHVKDAEGMKNPDLRGAVLKSTLVGLEGAEGPKIDQARARVAEAMAQLEGDRAALARCGDRTIVGTSSVGYFLRRVANDPKSIKVESCGRPVLTDRCWQVRCEFFYRNAFNAVMRQTANFYAEGDTVVGSDAF
jgi:hypothetical protein